MGGAFPYLAGDSLACVAWKLAATVCTDEPVSYYSGTGTGVNSWNFQCTSSGGFTDPTFGTFCSVTSQFVCTGCPGSCNAGTCSNGPLSLRSCDGRETSQATFLMQAGIATFDGVPSSWLPPADGPPPSKLPPPAGKRPPPPSRKSPPPLARRPPTATTAVVPPPAVKLPPTKKLPPPAKKPIKPS
jgi:hypothetical protein